MNEVFCNSLTEWGDDEVKKKKKFIKQQKTWTKENKFKKYCSLILSGRH